MRTVKLLWALTYTLVSVWTQICFSNGKGETVVTADWRAAFHYSLKLILSSADGMKECRLWRQGWGLLTLFPLLWSEGAWDLKWSHSTNCCPGMDFHLRGKKKEQLCDPCTSCAVPEAISDNPSRCLESKCAHLCLAIEASWLSAVSLALCFTNEALVGESRWFVFASAQWLTFVLWLLPLKHLTNIWKSASTCCQKELVTGISLYIFFLNKCDSTDILFLSEYGRY